MALSAGAFRKLRKMREAGGQRGQLMQGQGVANARGRQADRGASTPDPRIYSKTFGIVMMPEQEAAAKKELAKARAERARARREIDNYKKQVAAARSKVEGASSGLSMTSLDDEWRDYSGRMVDVKVYQPAGRTADAGLKLANTYRLPQEVVDKLGGSEIKPTLRTPGDLEAYYSPVPLRELQQLADAERAVRAKFISTVGPQVSQYNEEVAAAQSAFDRSKAGQLGQLSGYESDINTARQTLDAAKNKENAILNRYKKKYQKKVGSMESSALGLGRKR